MSSLTPLELLNPESHRHLRLRPPSEPSPHFVQIVVTEFPAAAVSCPILFTKEAVTGNFYAGALFGFKPGESFLQDATGRGGFNPLNVQREGFFISGEGIAIDRNHPRFSETQGEPLFDEAQQPSICLRRIQRALGQLQAGLEMTDAFIRALCHLKLIERIDIVLDFDGGERLILDGLYTVSLDRIRDLDDAVALGLFRSAYLQFAYTMSVSLKQIPIFAQLRHQAIRRMASGG